MKYLNHIAILFYCTFLAACSTATESSPPRTATEQLLISTAAERAADKLSFGIPKGTKVFVDSGNFEGYDSKNAVSAIRASLLKQGANLVDDKKNADAIVEIRAGALSVDKDGTLVGLPSINIPIPLATSPLPFPEVALYKSQEQTGVAKFAFVAYDAKTGQLIHANDPAFGYAHKDEQTVLIFYSWTTDDSRPKDKGNGD